MVDEKNIITTITLENLTNRDISILEDGTIILRDHDLGITNLIALTDRDVLCILKLCVNYLDHQSKKK